MRKREDIDMKRILELTKEGLVLVQIADQEHVGLATLYKRIREAKGTPEYVEYKNKRIKKNSKKSGRKQKNINMKRILELTKQGLTLEQIADQEHVSYVTLNNRIREAEGTPEHNEYKNIKEIERKDINMKRILELTKQGLTLEQIHEQEHVSFATLYRRIREAEGTLEYNEYKNIKELERKEIDMRRILELTKQGLTLAQITDQEHVCLTTLGNRIREAEGTTEYEEYKRIQNKRKKSGRKQKNIDMKRILELTKQGLTLEQIADQEHVSRVTLNNRIREAKGTPEYNEYKNIKEIERKDIDMKRILELTKQGLTLAQIADQEHVSPTTLGSRIREAEGTPEHNEYMKAKLPRKEGTTEYEEYKRKQRKSKKRGPKRKNIDMKRILELIKQGLTLEQIADQEHVSPETLNRRIREAEGTTEYEEYKRIQEKSKRIGPKRKDIDMKRMLELTKQGLTLAQITDQEHVCLTTLGNRIREAEGTTEYEEYMKAKQELSEASQKKKTTLKQNIGIIPDNKRLLVFMLGNGATPEEITEIYVNRGLEMNAREQLEQYIADISKGRLKPTALERNMVSYVKRLLNIKMEDIAELEGLVSNKSPIHRISSQTNIEELVQQYNIKSGKSFSRLELEFVLNRIKNAKENIPVSPYIKLEGETLLSKIEDMYDSIELDRVQAIR